MKKNNKKYKKKLYWFHPHFYNWMGGHKFIYEVIIRLKKKYSIDVTLVTSGLNAEAKNRFKTAGVPIITLFKFSTNSPVYWIFLPFFLSIEKIYLLYVRKINKNAMFISSMFPANTLISSISSKSAQLCYEPFAFFYDLNFIQGFNFFEKIFISFVSIFYKNLDKKSVQKNSGIFTISKANAKWNKEAYGVDSKVVYEGVDTDFFKKNQAKNISKKYANKKIIFHSTDYTQIKGTKYLIRAIPEVIKLFPNATVVISETIPNSPAKTEILAEVAKYKLAQYIEFAGFLPYDLLPEYLSLAEVVVQPSIQQSMNLTVKEAMACETVIITSPEGNEQTKNGEAGYLVSPHDTSSLSQIIIECLKNKRQSQLMGKIGRKIIDEKFSWDSVTEKIWKELKKIYG